MVCLAGAVELSICLTRLVVNLCLSQVAHDLGWIIFWPDGVIRAGMAQNLHLGLKTDDVFRHCALPQPKDWADGFPLCRRVPVKSYRGVGHYNNHLTVMPDIVSRQTA